MTGMPVPGHHAWGRAYGHDTPSSSSSFSVFFLSWRRWQWVEIPVCCHPWLFFFSYVRWQWTSWLIVVFCIFFFNYKKRRQARILTHHCPWLFCFSCKKQQWTSQFIVVFYIFSLGVEDNNKSEGSLSFPGFFPQVLKMTTFDLSSLSSLIVLPVHGLIHDGQLRACPCVLLRLMYGLRWLYVIRYLGFQFVGSCIKGQALLFSF